jgi:hypothetical protein
VRELQEMERLGRLPSKLSSQGSELFTRFGIAVVWGDDGRDHEMARSTP